MSTLPPFTHDTDISVSLTTLLIRQSDGKATSNQVHPPLWAIMYVTVAATVQHCSFRCLQMGCHSRQLIQKSVWQSLFKPLCSSQLRVKTGSTKQNISWYTHLLSHKLSFLDMVKQTWSSTQMFFLWAYNIYTEQNKQISEKKRKACGLMLLMNPIPLQRVKRGKMSDRLLSWASPALHNSLHWGGEAQRLFQHHTKRKGT